jgi:hypothetical protein
MRAGIKKLFGKLLLACTLPIKRNWQCTAQEIGLNNRSIKKKKKKQLQLKRFKER